MLIIIVSSWLGANQVDYGVCVHVEHAYLGLYKLVLLLEITLATLVVKLFSSSVQCGGSLQS